MHPKDKISNDQKKDLVYHWECKADGCNSSYIGEMSRALGERVKEHSMSTTSTILKHCKDFHHPLPSISDFNIIDKDPSQITRDVISRFLQLLWMLYCSCIILCLYCKLNKVIKSFCFVLFNVYFYSLSTATVTMSIPILIT